MPIKSKGSLIQFSRGFTSHSLGLEWWWKFILYISIGQVQAEPKRIIQNYSLQNWVAKCLLGRACILAEGNYGRWILGGSGVFSGKLV